MRVSLPLPPELPLQRVLGSQEDPMLAAEGSDRYDEQDRP
jgi:hypothetical protein